MRSKAWQMLGVAILFVCAVGCVTVRSVETVGSVEVESAGLMVRGGEPVVYVCDSSEQIIAKYFSLSDDSLQFVKVTMPDGKEHTLPRAVSASGARYTNEMILVWWIKGNTAFVQERDENGKWQITYNCTEIRTDK